jgi:hypothetical protein
MIIETQNALIRNQEEFLLGDTFTTSSSVAIPVSALPSRIHYQDLVDLYHVGNNKFTISGTTFIWKHQQLIDEAGGADWYMLIDDYLVKQ